MCSAPCSPLSPAGPKLGRSPVSEGAGGADGSGPRSGGLLAPCACWRGCSPPGVPLSPLGLALASCGLWCFAVPSRSGFCDANHLASPLVISGHVSFKTATSLPFSFQNLLKSQAQVLSCIYSAIYIFLNSLIVYKWACRRVRRYTDAVNSRRFYQASRLFSCNFNTCIAFCCTDVS